MEPPKGDTEVKTEVPVKDPSLSVVDPKARGGEDANTEIALSDEVEIKTKRSDPTTAQAPTRTSSGSKKSVHWRPELVSGSQEPDQKVASSSSVGSNPYIDHSPAETSDASLKDTMESVKGVLGRWGRKVVEAAKKTESLAGNTWQHRIYSITST